MKEIVLKRKSILIAHILMCLLAITMSVGLMLYDMDNGGIFLAITLLLIGVVTFIYLRGLKKVYNQMLYNQEYYGGVQAELLDEFSIAYAILDEKMNVVWTNKAFRKLVKKDKSYHGPIEACIPMLSLEDLPKKGTNADLEIEIDDRQMRLQLIKNAPVKNNPMQSYTLYLFDETVLKESLRALDEQKPIVGLVYIDNYEELMSSIEEVRQSLLLALVERKITKYFAQIDGIVKKLDKDKFFVLFKRLQLDELVANRFELLKDVKSVNIGNEMSVTISMGIGMNEYNLLRAGENAGMAMDLALGRGGDQCVVKSDERTTYYGGNSQSVEKHTRVKARVKAHALRELMNNTDQVIIMGHQMTDVDCFGAAMGVYRAAVTIQKKASIVINTISTSIESMIEPFLNNPIYDKDMFLDSAKAIERADRNTLLVVVDTNRPSYTDCPELLGMTSHIVVFDHHRQGEDVIENAELSYIEPYASSASEMVAEVLQYFSDSVKLKPIEADCVYAGIVIDTNNFTAKTGARTFDAAAYLKRNGADLIRVRKLFRDDIASYKSKAEAISTSEIYLDDFAIASCNSDGLKSPTIVGAQTANELLNIVGIKASFVLSEYKQKTFISARSIDEVNVQVIMERLGGGGHLNIAGAQMEKSIEETKAMLKDLLLELREKGEL